MQHALSLAEQGRGWVSPNPCVGCVVVKNGKVVGEGYHRAYGGPHAEVHAIRAAGKHAKGATAYITLEPCTHFGKTPPCAPLLINSGVKEVFIASQDPNPMVSGKGIKALRTARIKVHVGLEEGSALYQNRSFWTWKLRKRPHIVLKAAMTLDGKIATAKGESRWISGEASRRLVHRLRGESDAVLVGAQTAISDNPILTSHGVGRDPIRIVLDPHLRTPTKLKIYHDRKAPTVIISGPNPSTKKAAQLEKQNVQILRNSLKFGSVELINLLKSLSNMNVSQILIEGGGNTHWSFIREGLVDEVYLFVAPFFLGGAQAPTVVEGPGFAKIKQGLRLKSYSVSRIGEDILIHGLTRNSILRPRKAA